MLFKLPSIISLPEGPIIGRKRVAVSPQFEWLSLVCLYYQRLVSDHRYQLREPLLFLSCNRRD